MAKDWRSFAPRQWLVRRRMPPFRRADRWVLASLFCLAIALAVACPVATRYLDRRTVDRSERLSGVVVGKYLETPSRRAVVPIRWYLVVETETGERKRLRVSNAMYKDVPQGARILREESGEIRVAK